MKVGFYATLRPIVGGPVTEVQYQPGETTGNVLDELFARFPSLREEHFQGDGSIRTPVNIFMGGREIRHLNGLDTVMSGNEKVDIFPPVAGG